ncbi:GAF domain-containing protein [Alteromonas sp. KUL49]|uniref:GAF domain-containing protein n=1 Tax=Alteromonas sp. KUL49 TaxID=2480798 RepID=UPI00102F2641|nr:GAF domain-containing protein [Alteromonas sp. KUL49]TAP40193.1 GAF domain-containing protein [Alteromonas sp. KUL49]GEA11319.1 hypothetical protein KUL49_16940 [Alteromonas sp. KUL49]
MDWYKQLQTTITDNDSTTDVKVSRILELGLDALGLGIAIVSRINDDVYTVQYAVSPGDMITPGTQFSVGETYCCHTLNANHAVGFHNAGKSVIATHPCYTHFKLESYIGAPITSNSGIILGTVNFSAAMPRDPFTEDDFKFINAIADWLGSVQ